MKSFQQFLTETINISGNASVGAIYVGGESSAKQMGEQYMADVFWNGQFYRMKLEAKSAQLPTTQELAEQLQSDYPGAIVQQIYPVEQPRTVNVTDVKRYHPSLLSWVKD